MLGRGSRCLTSPGSDSEPGEDVRAGRWELPARVSLESPQQRRASSLALRTLRAPQLPGHPASDTATSAERQAGERAQRSPAPSHLPPFF